MKQNLFKGKSTRTKIFTVVTVCSIVVLLALNYLITFLTGKNALYIDMTPETIYTLSDEMKEECAFIDELDDGERELKITFCADPDTLLSKTVTRVIYVMALQMQREYDNLSVETVNVSYNPTAVAEYKPTTLTQILPTDIIISYGDTYRIVGAESFWMKTSEETYFSYNGEYRMASLMMSVTAIDKPSVYFTVNHGESYYDVSNPDSEKSVAAKKFYDLLTERGFNVGTLDLSQDGVEVPEDCAVLIINNPTSDFVYDESQSSSAFYSSETRKIDRYLRKNQGSLMVARDYKRENLTNLDAFLFEWGFKFGSSEVTDSVNHIGDDSGKLLGVYETDSNSYANAIYGEFANLPSSPHTVFTNTGYVECSYYETDVRSEDGAPNTTITYNSFMTSYDSAVATKNGIEDKKDELLDLAAVSVRHSLDETENTSRYSYVFCASSADFFGNELLGNTSYANSQIVNAVINNISRVDEYASMNLGGGSINSPKYGGKQMIYDILSDVPETVYNPDATYNKTLKALSPAIKVVAVVMAVIIPLIPLVICIIIRVKRKYL